MSCQVCVCVCVYFEQWIVSFILNSGLYHLFWTVDCIIYSCITKVYKLSHVTSIMANSVDPDQTLQIVAYDQGQYFLYRAF